MKSPLMRLFTLLVTGALILGVSAGVAGAYQQDDSRKLLDEITLADGRHFVGDILSETDETITMEVILHGIKTTRTFQKSQVLETMRDSVALDTIQRASASSALKATTAISKLDPNDHRRGVYVLPIRGLIGWDVYDRNIRKLWQEAVDAGAKTVVLEFDCFDGFYDLDEYRDLMKELKRDARENEIEIVVWIKQAKGVAVAFALMFENIYFKPDGVMGDGDQLDERLKDMWKDPVVRAKMISAWTGICRGMAEQGGYDALLCEAMIRPEIVVSMQFEGAKGRFVRNLDENNTPVDESETEALELDAEKASEYGISDKAGTPADLDDLMQMLGYREFVLIEGKAKQLTEGWIELRDRGFEDYADIRADMETFDSWNEPPLKKLNYKINKLNKIKRMLRACPPHTKPPYTPDPRLEIKYGLVSEEQIDLEIDQIKRQIRILRDQQREQRRNSGGSGRGRGSGRGGGGGGGG